MSLTLTNELLEATRCEDLTYHRKLASDRRYGKKNPCLISADELTEALLHDVIQACETVKDTKTRRVAQALLDGNSGKNVVVPNFQAFEGLLTHYLSHAPVDGWLYVTGPDGHITPELITHIHYRYDVNRLSDPSVVIETVAYGIPDEHRRRMNVSTRRHIFAPSEVTRKRISDALADKGLFRETPELKVAYEASMIRFQNLIEKGFSQQFRFEGMVRSSDNYKLCRTALSNRKVIHDISEADREAGKNHMESSVFPDLPGQIPEDPSVRVFDLKSHDFYWVHAANLTPYVYDKTLRDKLVLPKDHCDLLDVLTTNLDAFVGDFIEGKSAGNVVLCKGIAGLGKTLTAEVYAELIERPLYSIHSGHLGTTAEHVDKNLQNIFQCAKRWSCVLLLDEADVFVVRRGDSLVQNAIVAEFLRSLEYFDGLLFMTTNRPDDIDEAILSRCAAIIRYEVPQVDQMRQIWQVMADQYKTPLSEALLNDLVTTYDRAAPRDIKMLFRLALRVSQSSKTPVNADIFRRCAMFRDISMSSKPLAA
jgi:hypothetical protein